MLCSRVRVPHEDEMLLTKPPDSSAGAAARVLRTEQGPEAKLHRGIATKEDKGPLDVCKDAFNSNREIIRGHALFPKQPEKMKIINQSKAHRA